MARSGHFCSVKLTDITCRFDSHGHFSGLTKQALAFWRGLNKPTVTSKPSKITWFRVMWQYLFGWFGLRGGSVVVGWGRELKNSRPRPVPSKIYLGKLQTKYSSQTQKRQNTFNLNFQKKQ